ncbi:bestrophin-like domain [Bradyrhizobium sp. Arg314]
MGEVLVGIMIFACLAGAAMASLMIYSRLPEHHRQEDTGAVVRLAANLFVVMSSLVLGLMINSAKNTFETIDHNVHNFATQLIILDRSLRVYGPETEGARATLTAYLQRLVDATSPTQKTPAVANRLSELLLNKVGDQLAELTPPEARRAATLQNATQQLQKVIEQRWVLVGQSEGIIPVPLIALLVAWLMLIFASFGFRAPRNATIVGTFIVSSALAAAALYLIMDMDTPFTGPIQISPAPLQRALAELKQ